MWRMQCPGSDAQQYEARKQIIISSKKGKGSQMAMGVMEESERVAAIDRVVPNRDQGLKGK